MAPCPNGPRNRLDICKMKKTFDAKMECFTYRLEKWSEVLKQPVFTFKTKDKYEDTYEVMSVEKYFDYLLDIHVIHTDHGDVKTMMEAIQEEGLWMPYEALYVFHRVCSKCSVMRRTQIKKDHARLTHQMNISDENYRTRGFVEIIDMTNKPDGEYKYLLLYKDLCTRFTRMRALKNPVALEVAEELFEIFMTSGAPAVLHTPVQRSFTKAIIKNLESLMPDIKILVGNRKASRKKTDKIIELVDKWLANNNNVHWNIGIHYVAAEMNNIKKPSMLSPFEALYDKKPGTGLIKRFSSPASRTLFKKLQKEEDLLLPSVEKYVMSASEDLSVLSSSGEEMMLTEWCAVCGNDDADSVCEQCGVAIHLKCNTENEKVCDCCMKPILDHKHNLQSQKAADTSATVTQLDNIVEMENVNKTEAPKAKNVKTAKLPVLADPVKMLTAENIPSTSAQPNNMDNLMDDRIELKVGKIIGQYKRRKKPIAKDCTTQLGEVQNKVIEQESVNVTYVFIEIGNKPVSIKNEPVDIESVNVGNEPVDVKNELVEIEIEPVDVKNEPVEIKMEPVDVKNEPVDVGKKSVNIGKKSVYIGKKSVNIGKKSVNIGKKSVNIGKKSVNIGNKSVNVRDDAVDVNQKVSTISVQVRRQNYGLRSKKQKRKKVETINVFDDEIDIVKNEPY